MSSGSGARTPSYYEILQLPPSQALTKTAVKAAYHRALLIHHPDKATRNASAKPSAQQGATNNNNDNNNNNSSSNHSSSNHSSSSVIVYYPIDQIVAAYETLADPPKRRAYDAQLDEASSNGGILIPSRLSEAKGTHAGVEAFDLEDLTFDEETNTWQHDCRCGNEEGYVVTEGELEGEAEHGEIYVGCRGCSLFIKVVFGVAEGEASTNS